jgi:putative peptide zinc metalloprotease protein
VWDQDEPLPTRAHPRLALVLTPRPDGPGTSDGNAWVFPVDRPLAPEPGDNQALAVNTTDGTITYDVAFALVWADPNQPATNTNEAYAFASCDSCAAVAIAFQVVLVPGNDSVVAPENLAGALNYDCANCLTYALARQLFITLDGPLSEDAMAQLDALWEQVQALGRDIAAVPLDEIDDRLEEFEQQITAIIEADQPGTIPSTATDGESPGTNASDEASPAGGASPTAGATPSDTDDPTATPGDVESSTPSDGASATPTDSPSPSTE